MSRAAIENRAVDRRPCSGSLSTSPSFGLSQHLEKREIEVSSRLLDGPDVPMEGLPVFHKVGSASNSGLDCPIWRTISDTHLSRPLHESKTLRKRCTTDYLKRKSHAEGHHLSSIHFFPRALQRPCHVELARDENHPNYTMYAVEVGIGPYR